MRLAICILLPLTVGCGSRATDVATVAPSPTNDPVTNQVINETVNTLNNYSGDTYLTNENGFIIDITLDDMEEAKLGDALKTEGYCRIRLNSKYFLNEYMKKEIKRVTITHEIGHCFGLQHSPQVEDIMYFKSGLVQYKDEAFKKFTKDVKDARGKH